MFEVRAILLMLVTTSLGSCANRPQSVEPSPPSGHHFAYQLTTREAVDLIQAFDDGSTTYLQFKEGPPAEVTVDELATHRPLPFTTDGPYVKVAGIHQALRVTVVDRSTIVLNQNPSNPPDLPPELTREPMPMSALITPPMPVAPAAASPKSATTATIRRAEPPPVGVPESLQTMPPNLRVAELKFEISALEEKVRVLSAQLDEAHQQGRAATLFARNVASSPRLVLTFADESSDVHLEEELLRPLAEAARAANRIYLHGHTDAYVASERGTELAIRRAVEVRKLLIAQRVEPERIRLFYRGAGNFLANNSTLEGKALNRRVEIEMRKW